MLSNRFKCFNLVQAAHWIQTNNWVYYYGLELIPVVVYRFLLHTHQLLDFMLIVDGFCFGIFCSLPLFERMFEIINLLVHCELNLVDGVFCERNYFSIVIVLIHVLTELS